MNSDVYRQSNWIVIKVAELFYLEGKSQKEIASLLNISESTTSRLIHRAKEEGIVHFIIRDPYMHCISLANALKEKFGLKDAVVVPTLSADGGVGSPLTVKMMVACEGARYIQRILQPDDMLGIAWGGTIYHLIQYLNPCQKLNSRFVTLHGGYAPSTSLVSKIAMSVGGEHHALLCDNLFGTENIDRMKNDESTRQIFGLFDQITVSLSGVGCLYPVAESPLVQYLPQNEIEYILNKSPYGDLMVRFFDKDGHECKSHLMDRTLAISFDTYKKIPLKIIVASGAHKSHTIRAILTGKLVDVLIVDNDLASGVLQLTEVAQKANLF